MSDLEESTKNKESEDEGIPLNCPPENVTASFYLRHEDLDPDEVSELLRLKPGYTIKKGDLLPRTNPPRVAAQKRNVLGIPKKFGFWGLNSEYEVLGDDVNLHLKWILDQLSGKEKQIRSLIDRGYAAHMGLRIGIAHWNTLLTLEPELLSRLPFCGLGLDLDIYDEQDFEDEDESP